MQANTKTNPPARSRPGASTTGQAFSQPSAGWFKKGRGFSENALLPKVRIIEVYASNPEARRDSQQILFKIFSLLRITSASAARTIGADLAPARAVTSGLVGWKLLLDTTQKHQFFCFHSIARRRLLAAQSRK